MAPLNKRLPSLPGVQALEEASNSPHIPTAPSRQVGRPTTRDPIRETTVFPTGGADYGTSWTRHLQGGAGGASDFSLGNQRTGSGGSGGGSIDFEGNMDANALIGLNPYLEENVTSFSHGGNMSLAGGSGGSVSMDIDNTRPFGFSQGPSAGSYVPHQPGSSAYRAYVNQGLIPRGNTTYNPHTGEYTSQANKGMKMSEYKKGGKYPHNMFHPETGYKIVADNAAMHNKLNEQRFSHNQPTAANGMKMKQYNQGGFFEQQANQSIQASHQANEQQALGQISGLLAKKLQGQMSPEQATSMASQMASQSGLANQPMVNQPMAAYGMKMKKYNHGGSMQTGTTGLNAQKLYGGNYEYYGKSAYGDLDPYDQFAYLAEEMKEFGARNAAARSGETIWSNDGKTGMRKKRYTQGGRF